MLNLRWLIDDDDFINEVCSLCKWAQSCLEYDCERKTWPAIERILVNAEEAIKAVMDEANRVWGGILGEVQEGEGIKWKR
ncbi:hypothetical protein FACS1894216_16290 [Synergistales bacterium]|nr:hypothetical protein FACS1894216_16290 [Synergistales bacterium]